MSSEPGTIIGFEAIELGVHQLGQGVAAMERLLGHSAQNGCFRLANVVVELCSLEPDSPGEGIRAFRLAVESYVLRIPSAGAGSSPVGIDGVERIPLARPSEPPLAHQLEPDRVSGLDHLVVRSRNVDATREFYAEALGLRVLFDRRFPDWGVRLCMLEAGDAVLEIAGRLNDSNGNDADSKHAESSDADGDESEQNSEEPPERDRLWGLTWRVGDADTARSRLAQLGLDVSSVRDGRRPGTRVFTVRNGTCGVPTLMIEPAA